MSVVIKNHKNKNRYCLSSTGLWVRDFTTTALAEDINNLINPEDYKTILDNESENARMNLASIDAESIFAPNVVIVSDGFQFADKQNLLKILPQDKVTIIGTNRSLAKWKINRRMDWYVVNNPYSDCLALLPPHRYHPRCVVSSRINPDFIRGYIAQRGVIYRYTPTTHKRFSGGFFLSPLWYVDDYRNPICAAIGLAHRWQVRRLLLFCCNDVFAEERPGAESVGNGLWMYPPQRISHGLVDGNLYWLTKQKNIDVRIASYGSGPEYKHAGYIDEDDLLRFFTQD